MLLTACFALRAVSGNAQGALAATAASTESLVKAIDSTSRIDCFLLTRVEWVTLRTNFD
jgi:hypothetical protein